MREKIEILPSLLSADFSSLQDEINTVTIPEINQLHLDVMDGHFVPNITFGPPLVKSIRGMTDLFLDTHLMIADPLKYIGSFAAAGADLLTIHYESFASDMEVSETLLKIRALGVKCGLSLKPDTSWEKIQPFLSDIDLVLVMTVEPGFGGQQFMTHQLPKIESLADYIRRDNLRVAIEVDGGIGPATAVQAVAAGATHLVAGNSVFGEPDRPAAIRALLAAAAQR